MAVTPPTEGVDGYQIVLLIHGIRTQADWGPMVRSKLEIPGQIEVVPIKFGYFDTFRFWFPIWTRIKPMERVYKQIRVALQKYRRDHPAAKLSIIAHSFGAYVGGEIVKRGFDIKIRLGLLGSGSWGQTGSGSWGRLLGSDLVISYYGGRVDVEAS